MDEKGFQIYLNTCNLTSRVIGDYISRSKRVEKHEGNLDLYFKTDGGASLIRKLTYSKEDEKSCRAPLHSIKFTGTKGYKTIYDGTASLKNAIEAYFEFKRNQ